MMSRSPRTIKFRRWRRPTEPSPAIKNLISVSRSGDKRPYCVWHASDPGHRVCSLAGIMPLRFLDATPHIWPALPKGRGNLNANFRNGTLGRLRHAHQERTGSLPRAAVGEGHLPRHEGPARLTLKAGGGTPGTG